MIKRAGLRFLLEAIQAIAILGQRYGQNFDRHVTTEFWIPRPIDDTHAAFTEFRDNRVLSDRYVGGNCFTHF